MKIKIDFTKGLEGWKKDDASYFRLYISEYIYTACESYNLQSIEFCELDGCYCEIEGCEDQSVVADVVKIVDDARKALTLANKQPIMHP